MRQFHPFAVPAQALAAATACDGAPGTAVLSMPNQGRGPSASVEVRRVREPSQIADSVVEGQWEVPTLALDSQTALGFLLAARDAETDPERPIAGSDVRALQGLAGFAVDLVGRGRVLPGVREAGDRRAMARWSAVVTGASSRNHTASAPVTTADHLAIARLLHGFVPGWR
jgi:hypothetical protein